VLDWVGLAAIESEPSSTKLEGKAALWLRNGFRLLISIFFFKKKEGNYLSAANPPAVTMASS
jgi:hypothetical protein